MTMRPHRGKADSRWTRCTDGIAAVEFALMAPLLLILLTGAGEIGIAAVQKMQLQAAVEAGELYALKHPPQLPPNNQPGLTAIDSAVTSSGPSGITKNGGATSFCGCPTTSGTAGIVSQGNCTTVCSDGKPPSYYVTVNAAITHNTLLPYLNLNLATLTASSTVRVQ
jgi:Flp pilus assembly protein TadG